MRIIPTTRPRGGRLGLLTDPPAHSTAMSWRLFFFFTLTLCKAVQRGLPCHGSCFDFLRKSVTGASPRAISPSNPPRSIYLPSPRASRSRPDHFLARARARGKVPGRGEIIKEIAVRRHEPRSSSGKRALGAPGRTPAGAL